MQINTNANAWGHQSVLDFFSKNRKTTKDLYPSEWQIIKPLLHEGIKVLDIGCAQGGMANVLTENLNEFEYVGIDINPHMIDAAQNIYPQHKFFCIKENEFNILNEQKFDLVLALGFMHLSENWRQTLALAYPYSTKYFVFDLRLTHHASIENKHVSYFSTNFTDGMRVLDVQALECVPYNVINHTEALSQIYLNCNPLKKNNVLRLYARTIFLCALSIFASINHCVLY